MENEMENSKIDGASLTSSTMKSFRQTPDMESFYRFIYENDLRQEALEILDEMLEAKRKKKITRKKIDLN